MHQALNKNKLFVKEHTGVFKAANSYDIFDLETKEMLMECREPGLGFFTKLFRFTKYKAMTPFDIIISANGAPIVNVKRGVTFIRSVVSVFGETGEQVGTLRKIFKLFKPSFEILSLSGEKLGVLEGNFVGWDFTIKSNDGEVLATISKKWAGAGKELFTSADNYAIIIADTVKENDPIRVLIFGAIMSIDMVLKEH
ncbi:MAG: hypothetical protein JNL95_01395 [Chitinophagales bacterium]|jgi:uncharacterized protein YxjI|nr:hypothetical protein [Chitinophagales bacterium]MBP6515529.1 hypothetical protein [Chitinophagales bacterium]